MRIEYKSHTFFRRARLIIEQANSIIAGYQSQGYKVTLRQLFYRFVTRDIIKNTKKEYDKFGVIIKNARLAGLIDWDAIVDLTRTTNSYDHFESPKDILTVAAETYHLDTRADQDFYIEVWIEKEAMLGIIGPVCRQLDVLYLACRGGYSTTAMWQAAGRIKDKEGDGKKAVILHLGDHDPSGIDMTRDIQDRLALFGSDAEVKRIALNMNQVEQLPNNPPSNDVKSKDNLAAEYIAEYGDKSWELDVLEPKVIIGLIENAVDKYTDHDKQQARLDEQESHKVRLAYIAENFSG